jgi:hypothetical protein
MASISSVGSFAIPATQSTRRQAERSVTAPVNEKAVKQEQPAQRVNDDQGRKSSEQVKATQENISSPPVTQADDKNSAKNRDAQQQQANGEQQKIEVAQQEAQRAEFDQQAGNVRNTEPNDVRPPSSQPIRLPQSDSFAAEENPNKKIDNERVEDNRLQRETASANQPAIDAFNQFQNINATPRQGQELNQFV